VSDHTGRDENQASFPERRAPRAIGSHRRILIVEDEPLTASLLRIFIGDLGEVAIVPEVSRITEILASYGPDIILMDVNIGDDSGFQVCRDLQADPHFSGIPVIFVTALDDSEHEEEAFKAGGVDYIRKPINPYTTYARVKTHLELKASRDRLASLAYTDGMTGVLNRRGFDERLAQAVQRSKRLAAPLSVALLDVDYFKSFNDTYGHQAGDECLKTIGAQLAVGLRAEHDTVARYGGEEFALTLPDLPAIHAFQRLETLRTSIEAIGIRHEGSQVSAVVTVSIGMVTCQMEQNASDAEILRLADERLYQAKSSGRNRVVWADLTGGA
jgi:diguanylate cyclase (GGDEF)-like protein